MGAISIRVYEGLCTLSVMIGKTTEKDRHLGEEELADFLKDAVYREWLKDLSYSKYLDTEWWKLVKYTVRIKHKNKCMLCGDKDCTLHTHHNSYEHRGEELWYLDDLILLCKECHEMYHNKESMYYDE